MKLGIKLQRICKDRKLSFSQLARSSTVPLATLHAWTTGRKSINPDQLRKVAATLQISTHELLFDESDPFENKADEILKELFSGDVRVTLHKIERKRSR